MGEYPDGALGEVFVQTAKQGSPLNGLMDTIAILTSLCLQYGVPLEKLCDKLIGTQADPSGFTGNKEIPFALSLVDYIFRLLKDRYIDKTTDPIELDGEPEDSSVSRDLSSMINKDVRGVNNPMSSLASVRVTHRQNDSMMCGECGGFMQATGNCHTCTTCGSSNSGCL